MTDALALLGMLIHVGALLVLCRFGVPAIARARDLWAGGAVLPAPEKQPRVALIVPFTGDTPAVRAGLASLLNQPGWTFEAFLAVRDEADPAAALARRLAAEHPHARLVLAGAAETCCQKNHSLLAGIRAAGDAPEILVFCDSTHLARPDFLTRITRPLREGRAEVASSHHLVAPVRMNAASLLHFFSALLVHLLQNLPGTPLLWGGATAIRRESFFRHGVDAIWARAVVDDFTMGPHLQRRGVAIEIAPDAALLTRLAPQRFGPWWTWWFRQLIYMKFCLPAVWLAVTLAPLYGAGLLLYSLADIAGGGWLGASYAFVLCAFGARLGRLCPRPVPPVRAGLAFLAMQILTIPCYLGTWLTNTIRWRGVGYRTRFGGSVAKITRGRRG
jgi:cellulose synthase/poly-beta-1,6-N-acetylglucosamine synthase-like glycosyltransferase